jgi:hypothetical protein
MEPACSTHLIQPWVDHPNIWWKEKIMKLFFMQFSPASLGPNKNFITVTEIVGKVQYITSNITNENVNTIWTFLTNLFLCKKEETYNLIPRSTNVHGISC